jgi:hypothetical protein
VELRGKTIEVGREGSKVNECTVQSDEKGKRGRRRGKRACMSNPFNAGHR